MKSLWGEFFYEHSISILIFFARMCVFSAVIVYLQFSSFQPKWIVICVICHLSFTRERRILFFLDSTSLACNSQASFSLPNCPLNNHYFHLISLIRLFSAYLICHSSNSCRSCQSERHFKQSPNTAIVFFFFFKKSLFSLFR